MILSLVTIYVIQIFGVYLVVNMCGQYRWAKKTTFVHMYARTQRGGQCKHQVLVNIGSGRGCWSTAVGSYDTVRIMALA